MPASDASGKGYTLGYLQATNKEHPLTTFFDVGAGCGTYQWRYRPYFPNTQWTALEVWPPYIEKYKLNDQYEKVIQADVREIVFPPVDVIFMGDVLEHMTKEEAIDVYERACDAALITVVSIPIIHYPQDTFDGNPYEVHVKDDWSHPEALKTFNKTTHFYLEGPLGVYIANKL